jgi:sirohydrochlorin cobaltochelatase
MTRAVEDGVVAGNFDGVILIAHGARDARWLEPFLRLRAELDAKLRPRKIVLSFMEFSRPSLAEAASELARANVRRILVVPIFLSGGGHVAHDIPALVSTEQARYPQIAFEVAGALGEEPEVARAMSVAVERLATRP